jgi:EAL domain-containing protein (putative c-di-GMP-specific phosphodiesterase class I)
VELDGELVELRSAVAVAPSGPSTPDAAALLRVAEAALRTAKRAEGRFAVADDEPAPSSIHRLELISELRQVLANGELELHLQPVVDLRGGRVARAEAHLRWRRGAERGGVPVELLELAEQSGLIQPLTRWMVGEVAAAALELRRRGHDLTVTCDLSLRELADPALCDFLALLVSSGELDPSTIEFEVAEVELMDDPIRAREVLGRLGALGLRIVVDDFGTGYSSLGAIEPLPVSGLKIDRSFVSGVAAGASDGAVVRSTVELCHELGLTVAADGVADERTLEVLAGFGCDLAQGPHLSDALALEPFLERVAQLDAAARVWSGVSRTA